MKVGKLLVDAQGGEARAKYGNGLIKEYSKKLTIELGKGYSVTNLKNMRNFYIISKSQALPDQLTWSHYIEILQINDINEISYYINITITENLSYRKLREKIHQNKTIGIIIAKRDNKYVMDYCTDSRIYRTTYELI